MSKIKISAMVLFLAALLCGCQETPEEVKNNMSEYGENKQMDTSDITYCSLDELWQLEDYKIEGNIAFDGKIDFSNVEEIDVLNLTVERDFLSDANKDKYTALFGVDKNQYEESDGGNSGWGKRISYSDGENAPTFSMMENGGMAYMARGAHNPGEYVIEERYDIDNDDVSDVEAELGERKVNVANVCADMEKWLSENMPMDGLEYRVSDVYVRKMQDGDNARRLAMCAEYMHKGMRLDNHTLPIIVEDDDYNMEKCTTFISTSLEYDGFETPCFFSRNFHLGVKSAEQVQKLVDFDSAVRILKETMSGFGVFHISKIYPMYLLKLTDKSEGPGAAIEARPSYAFLVTYNGADSSIGIIKSSSCDHYFFVDMVTGEVTSDLTEERK
ncbi:MAG: hypothetical protein HFH14_03745 [Lachnospiraceae bacterium]|nr:hypothetical protein [Lachnospiraceae bacterium]